MMSIPNIETTLKTLRLSGLAGTLSLRLQEAAANRLSHEEFLEILLQDELNVRQERFLSRRTKAAHTPGKSMIAVLCTRSAATHETSGSYDLASAGEINLAGTPFSDAREARTYNAGSSSSEVATTSFPHLRCGTPWEAQKSYSIRRPREQVTLPVFTVQLAKLCQLSQRLDAFGNDVHAHVVCERNDRAHDLDILRRFADASDERAIDLQSVHREAMQITER